MGASSSKSNHEQIEAARVDNIKQFFSLNENSNIMETLNLDDMRNNTKKIPLPLLIGGETDAIPVKNRNNNKDVFNLIAALEAEYSQTGGNVETNHELNNQITASSDSQAMQHIKEMVLAELNSTQNGSGSNVAANEVDAGCGCGDDKGTNQCNNHDINNHDDDDIDMDEYS